MYAKQILNLLNRFLEKPRHLACITENDRDLENKAKHGL